VYYKTGFMQYYNIFEANEYFSFCRGMQWNSPKNAAKTGGPAGGWSPQPMAATTGAGYRPMVSFHVILILLS
jgi:hypothetical protein